MDGMIKTRAALFLDTRTAGMGRRRTLLTVPPRARGFVSEKKHNPIMLWFQIGRAALLRRHTLLLLFSHTSAVWKAHVVVFPLGCARQRFVLFCRGGQARGINPVGASPFDVGAQVLVGLRVVSSPVFCRNGREVNLKIPPSVASLFIDTLFYRSPLITRKIGGSKQKSFAPVH